jgi:transposase
VIERCAGIDVGKKFIAVCVMTGPANGEARSELRLFGTTVAELQQARTWMVGEGCTHAIMESTGSYWKPVFNILEGHLKVALASPQEGQGSQRAQNRPQGCLVVGASAGACHAGSDPAQTQADSSCGGGEEPRR